MWCAVPRAPRKRGPGQPRKFESDDVVYHDTYGYCVITDFKTVGITPMYCVVRVMHPYNGAPYGEAVWTRSHWMRKVNPDEVPFHPATRDTVPAIYRGNNLLVERGCRCNCCVHERIPRGQVKNDGTYTWESESDG